MRFLILTLLLSSCSWFQKEASETTNSLTLAQSKRATWLTQTPDPYKLLGEDRCDGLTFLGLWDWSMPEANRYEGFYDHEYPEGRWNRDVEPCYEVGDSRSGISLEAQMGALRGLFAREDQEGIDRAVDYADEKDWVLGEGPREYTYLPHLALLTWKMQKYWTTETDLLEEDEADGWPDPWVKLKGYRGNVVANYIELKGCVYGHINPIELKFLEKLVEMTPSNPIYLALLDRYDIDKAGDQSRSLAVLNGPDFPVEKIPDGRMDLFDYGDAPPLVLWLWALRIVEGCP